MKEVCKIVALTYEKLEKEIKVGMTTLELDQIAEQTMRKLGAIPAQKGYNPGIKGIPNFQEHLLLEKHQKKSKD